jgi:CheY-like chemotaxis protein
MSKESTGFCERGNTPTARTDCSRCPIATIDDRFPDLAASASIRKTAIFLEGGRIRLMREIGRGGIGTVFSAVDERLDRIVAVKFLRPELQADPAMVEWFRQETRAAAAIVHSNVVTIYSSGQYGHADYFVAEYIDGPSLERLIAVARTRGEPFPLACALSMLDQVCAGLAVVHAAGVVHHDIKPGNVMIEAGTRRVLIMDFGIGGLVRPDQNGPGKSSIGGTPAYMAPEAFQATPLGGQAGRLADVYSLGVTIFETLTGVQPFEGNVWHVARDQHLNLKPPRPSFLRADLTSEVDALVLGCLAKRPADRPQSVEAVRVALRRASRAARLALERGAVAEARVRGNGPGDGAEIGIEGQGEGIRRIGDGAGERVRVVVADPDASFVTVVQEAVRLIDPRGTVAASRTVSKALELARRHLPHTIVAPLRKAGLNGLELLARVKSDAVLGSSSRVMLVTDRIGSRERLALERKGVASVLLTSAEPAEVARALSFGAPPRALVGSR